MAVRRLPLVVTVVLAFPLGIWIASTASGGQVQAKRVALVAQLDARQEVPRPVGVPAAAKGSFTATLVPSGSGGTLTWRLTFSSLSGRATAAHLHRARAGRAGPVVVALCGPCRARARGSSRVSAVVARVLQRRGAYVNVHTPRNPAGEIRGQVRVAGGSSADPPPTQPPTTDPDPPPPPPYP
jgi:hypothetical protein